MNIVVETKMNLKDQHYEMSDFLAEVIEKYDALEDAMMTKRIQQAEKDEQLSQDVFFASLDKVLI